MSAPVRFRSVMTPPPGGRFFYELGGERVEATTWLEMKPKVEALMAKHGVTGYASDLVAEYMCPHVAGWYCTGVPVRMSVTKKTALENAEDYFGKELVQFNEIEARLRACQSCPMHEREVCLTCTGILKHIKAKFGGRRPRLLEDDLSGICGCAKTFEAVISSVDVTDAPEWDGIPDTCWRKQV